MLGSLDRIKYVTILLVAIEVTCVTALVPLTVTADELSDATTSIRDLESELELLQQKNDSIDRRMESISTSTVTNSAEMSNSLFNWSNPSLWLAWIVLVMAIALLYFMRRSTMVVTIGPKLRTKRETQDAKASLQEKTYPLAKPLKIVKIKVRKISKLNKSHAP